MIWLVLAVGALVTAALLAVNAAILVLAWRTPRKPGDDD